MIALGKLKEGRAVENIASKLNNGFDGDTAYNALVEMGPVAQGVMLKYFNHPDGRTRDRARTLLQGYNTNPQFYFAAFCTISITRQRFLADMGLVSTIRTLSPIVAPSSSCAINLEVRRT